MIGDSGAMAGALALACRGLGRVRPNPAVGCVMSRDGIIIGRGWTQPGGRPHAETVALAQAGAAARGATAYVTLEPCAHHGQTPPCADALIAAGISRCVVAIVDPDPRVSGRGIARLREAGVAVELGLAAEAATGVNAGFLQRVQTGRPLVTLKLATSLDGKIGTRRGESQWITGAAARRFGHLLRYTHDAVLVGSGTVLADNPMLTVRLAGLESSPPCRIILDGRLRTPVDAKLVASAGHAPTYIVTGLDADPEHRSALAAAGIKLIDIDRTSDGRLDLTTALQALGALGMTRILVEGGAVVASSLLQAQLVDRIAWFRSAGLIGGDGVSAISPFGDGRLEDQIRGRVVARVAIGDDFLETIALAA